MKFYMSILLVGICGNLVASNPLESFWRNTSGKTVRRLPVQLIPENAFVGLGNADFETNENKDLQEKIVRDVIGRYGPYNCLTLTLRCRPDLSDKATEKKVADVISEAHRQGLQVFMDVDARIAREEFFNRWPDEAQSRLAFEIVPAVKGIAQFRMIPEFCRDHMCYNAKRAYDVFKSRILNVWLVRRDENGAIDPSSFRNVKDRLVETETSTVLSGKVTGLKDGDELIALGEFTHWSADVFSPNLIPFVNEMITRYKTLGADGAMHDEWGFPPTGTRQRQFMSFWYSKHFAEAWKKDSDGRDMLFDALLMVCPIAGRERERSDAIDRYFRLTFERNAAIETAFYDENKRLWGPDVHVTKHATWHSRVSRSESFHNGIDWWAAKRDWAQSDECCDVGHCLGMMRTFGGSAWLNEGYGPDPDHYARTTWRYALCGGRMVYHGIYGGAYLQDNYISAVDQRVHCQLDILAAGGGVAESRVRLLNCITSSQIASACALVFGHSRTMNWLDNAFEDGGCAFMHSLGKKGWYVDAFPSSGLSSLYIDDEGWIKAGAQCYPALVLHRISKADWEAWERFVAGRSLKTRLFLYDPISTPEGSVDVVANVVSDYLSSTNAVRQTPFGTTGLHAKAENLLPDPDGTVIYLDGTVARIKGALPDNTGDPIEGILSVGGNDVIYAAKGVFAARMEKNSLSAFAAGALTRVKGGGVNIELECPVDVAMIKLDDKWHGLMQTANPEVEIPMPLKKLADDWRILVQPDMPKIEKEEK